MTKLPFIVASVVLSFALLAGCAASPEIATSPDLSAPETISPSNEPQEVVSDVVPFSALTSATTCIFSPEELTAAYASGSDYVAGPGVPDTSGSQASCEYAHADPALQYVATPFSIWVKGYSYADADMAFRAGYEDLPAPNGLDRAAITSYYCPPGGGKPAGVGWAITCEETANAIIIVFDDYMARVVRDDIVWEITASGATSAVEDSGLSSILQIARLASDRTI